MNKKAITLEQRRSFSKARIKISQAIGVTEAEIQALREKLLGKNPDTLRQENHEDLSKVAFRTPVR